MRKKRRGEVKGEEEWRNSGSMRRYMKKRGKHYVVAYESTLSQTVDK